jgi:endonuclease/exonuclease/phosphatase family metal-dependent hydrolase
MFRTSAVMLDTRARDPGIRYDGDVCAIVSVGTWNLENLFRPGSPGGFGPRTQEIYDAKLDALAAVIGALAPDVLAVQEVGDPDALGDLVSRLEGEWQSATSHVFEPDHPIRVGFLSRLEFEEAHDLDAFPAHLRAVQTGDRATDRATTMGRGALHVRVRASGTPIDLVTCHLKSKLLEFPGGRFEPTDEGERARFGAYALFRRAAQATTVRDRADTLLAGEGRTHPVIVLGDLNDEPLAATTQILLGPPGSEIGTPGETSPDRGDAWRLWNLAPRIPEEHRFTRIFNGRPELIDHILVSHALLAGATDVDTGVQDLPSVGLDPAARRDATASDHSPVLARITLP